MSGDAHAALSRAAEGRGGLSPEALATLGMLAGRVGRLSEAEPLLRQASGRDFRQPGTRLELANVCLRIGKFQEARSRDDVRGPLPCGVRQGREPVYVTWTGDHQLVAIEFLPEDLQPGR